MNTKTFQLFLESKGTPEEDIDAFIRFAGCFEDYLSATCGDVIGQPIETALRERIATEYTPYSHETACQHPVFLNSEQRVLRTRRRKPTRRRKQRRDQPLISSYRATDEPA